MKLVALYKTFDGGEFVDASLASIYPHVDAIVMVHSDLSWLGEEGNTVYEAAMDWCDMYDGAGKIHHLRVELMKQEEQYAAGIAHIEKYKLGDVIMVVDADEVWESRYIENAKRFITDNPAPAYRCSMHTYLKTPFFQVDPPYGSPIAFLREPKHLTTSPRGCKAPALHLPDCWMHHYTYVRETREDVARKLKQSAAADKSGETIVPGWMENVYDRMPEGENLHAFTKHTSKWRKIRKVWLSDMPPAMRTAKMLGHWFPVDSIGETMIEGEMNALRRVTMGRTQAVDLGTYKGLSAVTLALSCRRVHTIDCYDDLPAGSFADTMNPRRYESMDGHSLTATKALAARFGNITCAKDDTRRAARRWHGAVDVLFVDADHSEAGTMGNVEAWLPHMRKRGRIILHDNNDLHPGVQATVRRMLADRRFGFVDPGEYSGSLAVFDVL